MKTDSSEIDRELIQRCINLEHKLNARMDVLEKQIKTLRSMIFANKKNK